MAVERNILANLLGKVWAALMNFAFVPAYIHLLGVESYGLIGFFASIMAAFFILDMGFSTAVTRELAKADGAPDSARDSRQILRTLEVIYWAIAVVIGVTIALAAPILARDWLKVGTLSIAQTELALRITGLVAIFRWPVALYSGALMGLRRQVSLNIATSIYATAQGVGAVAVLSLIAPNISLFFAWQALTAAGQVLALAYLTWRAMPADDARAYFHPPILRGIVAFSMGVSGITILSVLLTQLDKFLLSRFLSLEYFGYYSIASNLAGTLNLAGMAIYGAVFPVISSMVSKGQTGEVRHFYHDVCQLLSVIIFPASAAAIFFSNDILTIFLHDAQVAAKVSPLFSLLLVGNSLLTVMLPPLALQLAYGWTRLSLYKNVIAVLLYAPLLIVMIHWFGSVGAALVWIALTAGYVMLEIPIMHTRLMKGEARNWYLGDISIAALIPTAIFGLARALLPSGMTTLGFIACLSMLLILTYALVAMAVPATRRRALIVVDLAKKAVE